ncbi:TrlF family AAA-like ATPase [Parageobacillus thermoglucosidasius]|uniref:TrlF family AAA-like ATPase n=1 Tax=Parageobacillus thermoglucosidasius TaxID=1426 RepID=UPI0027F1BA89|nr:hypothetical protein PthstB1num2_36830 [Parageobacillus thermoglucosidasius]
MRWYKCDLQMQTPGDHYNWNRNCEAYLKGEYTEEELINSVDLYLKRCHEVGLHVIGITNHNFIGRRYLEKLIERNKEVARELQKPPLIIFPGFEIEISQGLGVHLLCLFDPKTPLDHIDDMVTRLGIPKTERVKNGNITPSKENFDEIIRLVQEDSNYPGLVIAAHPLAESGLLNDGFLTEYFQKDMFTNPKLLAMEIPKPVENLSNGWRKLILASDDCHEEWKRHRPIATIMSSDAYSLYECDKGYIGKRWTWIQMSNVSIESLRQAVLDHQSRIKLQEHSPDDDIRYGKIKSLSIKNVEFLEDQEIYFSPNLNCIIGGRGAGKSSIIEYIRLCTNSQSNSVFNEQVNRIKNTLNDNSILQLVWEDKNGLEDTFEFRLKDNEPSIISREDIQDKFTIFRNLDIQIYSQREISQMSDNTSNLLPLINRIAGEDLIELQNQENELKDKIIELLRDSNKVNKLKIQRKELEQEIAELKRQWDAFTAVKEDGDKKVKAEKIKKYLKEINDSTEAIISEWTLRIENLLKSTPHLEEELSKFIYPGYFDDLKKGIIRAKYDLEQDIKLALEKYKNSIQSLTIKHDLWNEINFTLSKFEENFLTSCQKQGLKPEDLEQLKEIGNKQKQKEELLIEKEKEILELTEKIRQLPDYFERLHNLWKEQTNVRKRKIDDILNSDFIPKIKDNVPFIKVEIDYMGDEKHFLSLWNKLMPDARTKLGKNWEEIGALLFEQFKQNEQFSSPWELLKYWIEDDTNMPVEIVRFYQGSVEHFKARIVEHFKAIEEKWNFVQLERIFDGVNISLYRKDGSCAGSLRDNGLSEGQKNTAILTLLLAQGQGPIIIDQPEDELDSDFIYNELVPLIRNVKINRQIILATHNANLPVNGDAELVYALQTNLGRGKVRAHGGLDNIHVRQAILDIMEGSEEAFRRRSEKYYAPVKLLR